MTREPTGEAIVLPALRGMMGDWVYYCCLMDLPTLAARVTYAEVLHNSKGLSKMIQRELKTRRSGQIAEYLKTRPDRLFNALVVATYGGQPTWHALTNIHKKGAEELNRLTDDAMMSVGFLTLRGDEKLFALDGQHRLSGIKRAVDALVDDPHTDEVPVMFVGHEETVEGLRRTRRLFTTLNKTATPVTKFETIALDEDDVMALTVRWLIDENPDLFGGERIAFVGSSNMPQGNFSSLTTIVNLYDILLTWYTKAETPLRASSAKLKKSRPDDQQLTAYFALARELFVVLREGFPELREFFYATDTESVVRHYRNRSPLFRPAGLHVFATIVAHLTQEMTLSAAVAETAKLPRSLDVRPFAGLMWDPTTQTIRRFTRRTLFHLLLHMLGRLEGDESELLKRYRHEVGDESLELPERIV